MTPTDFSFLEDYFQKAELLPAIVQEDRTGEVLMLAYMNEEALGKGVARAIADGLTTREELFITTKVWFYSRSRQELWNKGATSGHLQKVVSIAGDCDCDTLLVRVEQTGPACHTGSHSCFFREIVTPERKG